MAAPSAAGLKKGGAIAPLAMHRAAAVRRRDGGEREKLANGPVDFLARLELLEKEEQRDPTSDPPQSIRGFLKGAGRGAAPAAPGPSDGGVAADDVMEQLRQMNEKIEDMRTRKRERTPPEKHVGETAPL